MLCEFSLHLRLCNFSFTNLVCEMSAKLVYTFPVLADFVGKLSLGGTWHGRLGEPGGAGLGEPGGATGLTQHINKKSKNPISRA